MTPASRHVACPVALHPYGAPRRIPLFLHPQAGYQLVKGGVKPDEPTASAAARELFEESGLDTHSAIGLGSSDQINTGEIWHFALCRLALPVRARWAHHCRDDAGHLFEFQWHEVEAPLPSETHPIFHNALMWIRGAL